MIYIEYQPDWKPKPFKGRIRWDSPTIQQRIHIALEHGVTLSQQAKQYGIKLSNFYYHVEQHDLAALPSDRLMVAEVAERLNLTVNSVHALCHRLGVDMGYWGKTRTLTPEQADHLASREQIVHERPNGHVTVAELAALWGLAPSSIRVKIKGLPRLAWVSSSPRVKFLYDLRDASRRAPPVAPAVCPAGRWDSVTLAAALGIPMAHVTNWASNLDCPALKGRKKYYFKPAEVAAWLLTRRKIYMRAHGERLMALLDQQRAA